MKKEEGEMSRRVLSLGMGILCLLILGSAWVAPAQAEKGKIHLTPQIATVPARPPIYNKDVQELSMEQCSQCHIGVFRLLKKEGVKHQLSCTFCHTVYHTYAPGKVEYAQSIPKCVTCHGSAHGEDVEVQNCGNCHSNAHAPLNIPRVTEEQCQRCHAGPPQQLKQYPSLHTDVSCSECHTSHGYIPKCTMCHSEEGGSPYHVLNVADSVCLACHPVHRPLQIAYTEDTPQQYCAPCHKNESHERVLKEVKEADTKHNTDVTCAGCHDTHGKIPECSKCHQPHKADQTNADCARCHSNPHKPLNLTYPLEEPQASCTPCHSDVTDELQKSNTRHTTLTCAKCHPHHAEIPACQVCHGTPHGEAMMVQFKTCGACHGIAHNVQGRMK